MNIPVILLCGPAGVGKDTAAKILQVRCGAVSVAQADPMKRFVKDLFGFPVKNLWGPSGDRELPVRVTPMPLMAAKDRLYALLHELEYEGEHDDALAPFEACFLGQCVQAARQDGRLAARGVLQTFGTEFGRQTLGPSTWNAHAMLTARRLLRGGYSYGAVQGLIKNPAAPPAPLVTVTDGRFINEVIGAREIGAVPVLMTGRRSEGVGNAGHRSEQELRSIPEHFFASELANNGSLEDLEPALEDLIACHFGTSYHGGGNDAGGRFSMSNPLWREDAS